jgi:uncharacterized surface protein with fasciclin (FAS1) repeats
MTTAETMEKSNIVETAVAAGGFTTLASLLERAGLAETLAGGGPFTVFAPTDEAFEAVPQETLDALAKDREMLRAVLLYHVVEGEARASDVASMRSAETLNGDSVRLRANGDTVRVDGARVVKADVTASNGVIHVIDEVLIPFAWRTSPRPVRPQAGRAVFCRSRSCVRRARSTDCSLSFTSSTQSTGRSSTCSAKRRKRRRSSVSA